MKSYTKKVKGSSEATYDNDHYERTWETPSGKQGAYIIAQGHTDSTSKGYLASNRAVNLLGKSIEEKIEQNSAASDEEIHSFVMAGWKELQPKLGVHKTTLECLVVRNGTAHCYLTGRSQLYAVSTGGLVEQINPPSSPSAASPAYVGKELANVKFLFLATASLLSRVTEEQTATLLRTAEGEEAPLLLEKFARLVRQPREKLLALPKETLYQFVRGQAGLLPENKKELVDLIFRFYGRNRNVTEQVDKELRYDDVTMMLIDVEDRMAALLARDSVEAVAPPGMDFGKVNQELGEYKAKYEEEKRKKEESGKLLQQREHIIEERERQVTKLEKESAVDKAHLEARLGAEQNRNEELTRRLDERTMECARERDSWNKEKIELKERQLDLVAENKALRNVGEPKRSELAQGYQRLGIDNSTIQKVLDGSRETIQKYRATTSGAPKSPTTVREEPAKAEGTPLDGSPPKRSRLKRWGLGALLLTGIAVGGYHVLDYYVEKGWLKFTPVTIGDYVVTWAKSGSDSTPGRSAEEEGQKTPAASTAETLPPSLSSPAVTEKALGRGKRPSEDEGLSIIIDGGRKPSYAPGDLLFGSFKSAGEEIDYSQCKSVGSLPAMLRGNNFAVNIPHSWKENYGSITIMCKDKNGMGQQGVDVSLRIESNPPKPIAPVSTSRRSPSPELKRSPLELKITKFSCRQTRWKEDKAICEVRLDNYDPKRMGCVWYNYEQAYRSTKLDDHSIDFKASIDPAKREQSISLECRMDGHVIASASTKVELALKSPFGKGQANVPRAPALKIPSPPRRGAMPASSATTGSDRTRP